MIKEEHEVAVLGAPQSQAPVTTTVINIRSETSVPDHIVWSLFTTIFMNWCCLGFVAFAYSVKVGGHLGASPRKCLGAWRGPCPDGACAGEPLCVRVYVHALGVCVLCVCVSVAWGIVPSETRGEAAWVHTGWGGCRWESVSLAPRDGLLPSLIREGTPFILSFRTRVGPETREVLKGH